MENTTDIRPFRIEIPQADLDDLRSRLERTRWTEELPADPAAEQTGPVPPGWERGVPLGYVQRLVEQWRTTYDWRKWEAKLNEYPQFITEIDGQDIHFLHVRSPHEDATPLLLTHGWPNSILEYLDLIEPLTNPANPAEAFHLVIPSIPGFGFSGPTKEKGWSPYRVADAWAELMTRLGYERFGVHGNDAGSIVSPEVGRQHPDRVIGVHVTQIFSFPSGDPAEFEGLSEQDMGLLAFLQKFNEEMSAYAQLQATKPQNLAHALADSPAGQLAWSAQLLSATPDEHVLTNATIYWLTNTAASSARFYYEHKQAGEPAGQTTVPMGLASFAYDFRPLRRFADRDHANIVSWSEFERGSHWATQDAPDLLIQDLQKFFARFR